jgi:hypothetical protein
LLLDVPKLFRVLSEDPFDVALVEDAFDVKRPGYIFVVPFDCRKRRLVIAYCSDVIEIVDREDADEIVIEKLRESSALLKLQDTQDASYKVAKTAPIIRVG